ncbi:MAG: 30S ribosomal protein S1 [Lachnospiraceae bacterium]|nr:30S ribosomal protein S1 [Lachnospiraceae bacterium]
MSFNFLHKAIENKSVLEAKVDSCTEDNTLILNLGKNIIGKIPLEELEYHEDNRDIKPVAAVSKVGKHVKFVPVQIIDKVDGKYIVLCSRKESQKNCYENYIKKLIPGDIIDARVCKIMSYGIFCDIGCGIIALLPTNNISVTHIIDPENLLRYVRRMKVVVKEIDENYRVQLSHKELLGTWAEEIQQFNVGDVVQGTVLSREDYGTFVRLSQNLSGLAENPEFDVKYGDEVAVKITVIKHDNMKVKLLILNKIDTDENSEDAFIKFRYNIDSGHINEWKYSTPNAKKQIISKFNS